MCVYAYVFVCECSAHIGQKRASDSMELEFQVVASLCGSAGN